MKTEIEICPDCCVELKIISKKLDNTCCRKYLKCQKCGFIKRPQNTYEYYKELDKFRETHHLDKSPINRVNINKYFNH